MEGILRSRLASSNREGLVSLTPAQQSSGSTAIPILGTPSTEVESIKETQEASAVKQSQPRIQYQLKAVIGKGSFGVVYKAVNRKTNQVVAIKEVNYDNDEELNDIMSEIHLLKNLNHVNIVKYHGFIQKMDTLYIILEYCSRGSLKKLISPNRGIPEIEAQSYIRQTLQGLSYLHEQGVIHRDIKSANLLLDSSNVVKLADFGVSTKVNNASMAMTLAGSLNWMAPEIIGNRGASTLSDIWSLGATVVELLTGNPPFHNLVDVNIYYAIENDTYLPPENKVSHVAANFLSCCFQKNMYLRPTAKQLLQHEWLSQEDGIETKTPMANHFVGRLDRFKEGYEEEDYNWDDDFKEKQIDMSPRKKGQFTPVNSDPSTLNNRDNIQPSTISSSRVANETYLLKKLKQGQLISNMAMLFNDCVIENIVDVILNLLSGPKQDQVDQLVISLFEYDYNYNNSLFKQKFVTMGGMPLLLENEELIISCFIDYKPPSFPSPTVYRTLIESGIMNKKYFSNLKDPSLILELILKYLEVTSITFWCRWCEINLNLAILLKNNKIHEKISQTIMLKLSSHANWFSEILFSALVHETSPQDILSNPQTFHNVFKVITFTLMKTDSELNIMTQSSSNSPSNSIKSGLSEADALHFQSLSLSSNASFSNMRGKIPDSFINWLITFTNVKYNNLELFNWKYYMKVCNKVVQMKMDSLTKILYTSEFINLASKLLRDRNSKLIGPILQDVVSICVDLSMDLRKDRVPPLFFSLAISFTKIEKYLTQGIQITLNCLQLLLHENLKTTQVASDILSIDFMSNGNKSNIIIHSSDLVEPFFALRKDNVSFGNFLNTFTKLCSLQQLEFISFDLLMFANFVERIKSFFHIYRGSLLLQIDLLKFIKIVITKAINFDPIDEIFVKTSELVSFFNNNWDMQKKDEHKDKNNKTSEQVGCDSILIQQLCKDIEILSKGYFPNKNSATNFDNDGFAIPKWTA
ncbi:hypothetical protein Kpol_1037p6 [Vanderwaltozyma polyspora DSM 70294]|uniref:non-specific serine/threonine protein kinase n=1 Tax=Vanderwaltozyma polyspora (strain ATCC 22028 / DSM 70294 / BCRC 21397 / CBS 2163 / NBRC 10782 / NRRL Y-8283 / UCD 57-17) TaxID=436907 RepID=A7TJU8_VANPO|nr:uncharacterized protein Kpol_1037p6 [Vanderwaltozyma polyspora DSM 70294]EDO17410.1 hypothetical protein Kpol_1037p6 [Vanderwaltozyma polyspora DSM 70294]